jgi:serine/threonine protein kinase/lipopolysaccharide biosynthesis regulator YciM
MTSTSWSRKTTRSRWERLEELFNRAVDLPEQARDQFIREETGEDTELRDELLGLLACDTGKRTGPLTHALGEALDSTTRDKRRAHLNKIVGSYRLVSVLGHGGTGTVYLGERADSQYSAQVAVKIVESAAVHSDLATRFRAERQILASLNHPNIARLMDAGESEDGQPYLVMEYIQGDPLDKYSDERKLDLQARLRLFLEICGAVQYAHQNLVVHRDLKPANILVTKDGVAKLLDFGIAKLLDPGSSSSALALTRMNDRLLTPEYASPEQILGKPVTATSDVYALGVVLYELLTGLRPFVVEATASQLELERSICVTDPPRPSATLELGKALPPDDHHSPTRIALARSLNPERLRRRLAGDLDSIIMRALRKEPQHRYGSVDQLMADIRRYLANEPVLARQGNWIYYSKRFIRRNALAVSAAVLFVSLTVAFVTSTSIQANENAEQRERAQTVAELLLTVFRSADVYENPGTEVTARQLLDVAAVKFREDPSLRTEMRAELLGVIGKAYLELGKIKPAIKTLAESLQLWSNSRTPLDPNVDVVLRELGNAHRADGNSAEAERVLTQALRLLHKTKREQTLAHANLLADIARLESWRGNTKQSQTNYQKSLAMMGKLGMGDDPRAAGILCDLAMAMVWEEDLAGAKVKVLEATEILAKSRPKFHPDRIMADLILADVLASQGQLEEARQRYEQAVYAQRQIYGKDNYKVSNSLGSLANIRLAQKQPKEAAKIVREALNANYSLALQDHLSTGYLKALLGSALLALAEYPQAETELREALAIFDKGSTSDHQQYIASAEYFLGEVLLATNRLAEASETLIDSMNRWERAASPEWRSARSANALGEVQYRLGKFTDAEQQLVSSYRVLSTAKGAEPGAVEKARERVTRFYRERGQPDKLNAVLLPRATAAVTP